MISKYNSNLIKYNSLHYEIHKNQNLLLNFHHTIPPIIQLFMLIDRDSNIHSILESLIQNRSIGY